MQTGARVTLMTLGGREHATVIGDTDHAGIVRIRYDSDGEEGNVWETYLEIP